MEKKSIMKIITIGTVITIVCVGFAFKQMKVIQAYGEKDNRIEERYQESKNNQMINALSKTCEYGHTNCDGNCQNVSTVTSATCSYGHSNCDGNHDQSRVCANGHTNCDGNHTQSNRCVNGHDNCSASCQNTTKGKHHMQSQHRRGRHHN